MVLTASGLIEQRIGLSVTTQLRIDPEKLLREISGGDLGGFLMHLAANDELDPAWQAVIKAFAIGETYFFRDQAHFQLLRERILPALIADRRSRGQRTLNLWSVGCATGEEPYSLAILLHELLPDRADWTLRLIGTDVNAEALNAARRGVYRPWSFRQPEPTLQRYFEPVEGGMLLSPEIREMVTFRQLNLLKGAPLPQLDLILCRNVLLYFGNERAAESEAVLCGALSPGGWLFLGPAETLHQRRDGLVTHLFPGAPVYQKITRMAALGMREIHEARGVMPPPDIPKAPPIFASTPTPVPHTPEITVIPTYEAALRARQREEYAESERALLMLLSKHPDHAPAKALLACIYADQKRFSEAHTQLDRALSLDPLLADGHYLRGLLYLEEGRRDEARQAFQAAIYCQRNHPLASYTLGTLLAQNGEFPRAIKLWENARRAITSLKPESPLSDMSDMTAGRLTNLIEEHLTAWK